MYSVSKTSYADKASGWLLGVSDSAEDVVEFQVRRGGSEEVFTRGTTDVLDGQWHHIAGVLDRTANELRVYVDGNLDGTPTVWPFGTANLDGVQDTYIGRRDGSRANFFSGAVDEVRISNVALDPSEFLVVPEPSALSLATIDPATAEDVLDAGSGIKALTDLDRTTPGTIGILNHPGEPGGDLNMWFILDGLNNAELEELAADLREQDEILDARFLELGDDPDFLVEANLMVTFNGGASPGQSVAIAYNFGEGVTMAAFAVPEPSTFTLAVLGLVGRAVRRRRTLPNSPRRAAAFEERH